MRASILGLCAAVVLALPSLPAAAQPGDNAAIELAAMRYAQACSGRDLPQMYSLATRELRLVLRLMVAMADPTLEVSRTDDAEGFARAARDADSNFGPQMLSAGFGYIRFSRIVAIEVNGDVAECFVFDPEMQRLREESARGEQGPGQAADPAQWERLLITDPPPAQLGAEQPKPDPRKEATGLILLRREGKDWRVSMTAPVGPVPGAFRRPRPPRPGNPDATASDAGAAAILDAPVGKLTVGRIVQAATASHRTVSGTGMLDVFGPMSEPFRAFVVKRLGREITHAQVDLTFSPGQPGQVYLLNPSSRTVGDTGGATDKELWALMVEFAASNAK
jgi:hypothetical protein